MNAEHCGRAGANLSSLIVCDHVCIIYCLVRFLSILSSIVTTCHHGHATVLVYVGDLLLYIYIHVHVVFNEIA